MEFHRSEQREPGSGGFVTRRELAAMLKVSVRTVDEMVAAGEITPLRIRGVLVRFYLPDVVRELLAEGRRATAGTRLGNLKLTGSEEKQESNNNTKGKIT
jgi:excisionase family DNA binding protein